MVVELLGTRILAPYVGTSLYVWTSVIGVVLASLSIGYVIGGRIADSKNCGVCLPIVLMSGGVLTWALAIVYQLIPMSYVGGNIVRASLIASGLLFGPLTMVLGMVTPIAVRLRYNLRGTIGRSAGSIYAASTIGSIAGTFLSGYWLIPNFGMQVLLFGIAVILFGIGIIAYWLLRGATQQWIAPAAVACIGIATWCGTTVVMQDYAVAATPYMQVVADINTPYRRAYVWDTWMNDEPVRVLADWQSAIYLNEEIRERPVANYARQFRLVTHFANKRARAMMIGGAGYILPRLHLEWYPSSTIDVVEIDPAMPEIAAKYFFLEEDERIRTIIEDGRIYLNTTEEEYDIIYMDAFAPEAIPFHLVTKESFTQMHRVLTDDGVLVMNMIASTEGVRRELFRSTYATMSEVFPFVRAYVFAPANEAWNMVLVASPSPGPFESESEDRVLNGYLQKAWKGSTDGAIILTDDFAPVEHLNLQ